MDSGVEVLREVGAGLVGLEAALEELSFRSGLSSSDAPRLALLARLTGELRLRVASVLRRPADRDASLELRYAIDGPRTPVRGQAERAEDPGDRRRGRRREVGGESRAEARLSPGEETAAEPGSEESRLCECWRSVGEPSDGGNDRPWTVLGLESRRGEKGRRPEKRKGKGRDGGEIRLSQLREGDDAGDEEGRYCARREHDDAMKELSLVARELELVRKRLSDGGEYSRRPYWPLRDGESPSYREPSGCAHRRERLPARSQPRVGFSPAPELYTPAQERSCARPDCALPRVPPTAGPEDYTPPRVKFGAGPEPSYGDPERLCSRHRFPHAPRREPRHDKSYDAGESEKSSDLDAGKEGEAREEPGLGAREWRHSPSSAGVTESRSSRLRELDELKAIILNLSKLAGNFGATTSVESGAPEEGETPPSRGKAASSSSTTLLIEETRSVEAFGRDRQGDCGEADSAGNPTFETIADGASFESREGKSTSERLETSVEGEYREGTVEETPTDLPEVRFRAEVVIKGPVPPRDSAAPTTVLIAPQRNPKKPKLKKGKSKK